ncbi:hypothetical protein B0H65DRAFT_506811 [Neurospora tetraspora]|uniref:Uncharacterized protein n=1 Tax=Neurospora tetraspora TaxID=94610 RepID=A0AAE0JLF4_9PEZI|nr:hypothetical protein B0H65DRAFT_506811 [Neurospora tetraspora]
MSTSATGETDVASVTPDTSKPSIYGPMGDRENSKEDTLAGHFTFLEDHSRSSSIVESYSDTAPKSLQESFSSTVRNVASQSALRREEWPTGAQPTCPRPPPRTGPFFDAFRNQEDSGYLKPPPLSVSRPVEATRRQGRPRSSSVPLIPRQTPSLNLFPRIDPAPTPALTPKPSYPGSEISTPSHYPASSTAVSLLSTTPLMALPVPPKDTSLQPPVPRKDTPTLPPLRIPSQNPSSTGDVSMRNPIKGPALYTQPRPLPVPVPTPCRHQRRAMRLNTPYMQMLLALDKIPRLHNILVFYFTWLLLVAFIIVTASFDNSPSGLTGSVLHIMEQPLFAVSLSCMALGILGCLWLGIRWRRNYVWLINRLYMPLFLNGLAGVLATLASVYAQHEGRWCFPAIVAVVVEGVLVVVSVVLFGLYNFWLLRRVKKFESGYYGKGRKWWVSVKPPQTKFELQTIRITVHTSIS